MSKILWSNSSNIKDSQTFISESQNKRCLHPRVILTYIDIYWHILTYINWHILTYINFMPCTTYEKLWQLWLWRFVPFCRCSFGSSCHADAAGDVFTDIYWHPLVPLATDLSYHKLSKITWLPMITLYIWDEDPQQLRHWDDAFQAFSRCIAARWQFSSWGSPNSASKCSSIASSSRLGSQRRKNTSASTCHSNNGLIGLETCGNEPHIYI